MPEGNGGSWIIYPKLLKKKIEIEIKKGFFLVKDLSEFFLQLKI